MLFYNLQNLFLSLEVENKSFLELQFNKDFFVSDLPIGRKLNAVF
jgi:hypothetical protein